MEFKIDDKMIADIIMAQENNIKAAVTTAIRNQICDSAKSFIDVSNIATKPGEYEFIHKLTGRKLRIKAEWID